VVLVSLFFFISKVDGIPLGAVIHKYSTKENYIQVFKLFKKALGENGFCGQTQPSVFMTDDTAERQALQEVFPESILLLCAFYVC